MSTNLPAMDLSDSPTGCCPRFNPTPWEQGKFHFRGLKFISAPTRSLFYIPLNMSTVMTRLQKAVDKAGARPLDRYLILSRDESPWKARHYYLVDKDVEGFPSETLEGDWRSEVYEGPYSQMGLWFKDLDQKIKAQGLEAKDFLAFYTTCPKCAKAYGKNYVVLFARVG